MNRFTFLFSLVFACIFMHCQTNREAKQSNGKFHIPVEYYKLDNGLKVILSQDKTTPTVVVAVYYNIGFRIEPKERTGFAHLFEHMMFQGSENLGKMEFVNLVQKNGGILNGSTRFDFTNYFEVMPSHKLETMLWAEADRMKGLAITQDNLTNQQGVVMNEVKVNVLNQPYGGFPWLDMPQYANENWYNAHNFYGDLEDLEAANLVDVQDFFNTYYAPNNAAISIVGDFEAEAAKQWIEKYFGGIPSVKLPPIPDITEPKQTEEKTFVKDDPLANKPAIAVAYHMPERNTPEYFAMGILDQILVQGDNSLLHQKIVKNEGYTSGISGGINYLGNMFNYNGPMLWMFNFTYDNNIESEALVNSIDEVLHDISVNGITQEQLDMAMIKLRSSFYDELGSFFGVGKADFLCSFALFDDDPGRINELEESFSKVTPELINKTVKEYLAPVNRTIITVNPMANQQPS